MIEIPARLKNVELKFPIRNKQKLKFALIGLLPYPYRTYPYKLLVGLQHRKLKSLLSNLKEKIGYQSKQLRFKSK